MKYDTVTAINYIIQEFPEVEKEIRDEAWTGLFHMQMGVFSDLAILFIKDRREAEFIKSCTVAWNLFINGDDKVINAVNVSFLENIEFQIGASNIHWMRKYMPKGLLMAYDDMKDYNDRIHGKSS